MIEMLVVGEFGQLLLVTVGLWFFFVVNFQRNETTGKSLIRVVGSRKAKFWIRTRRVVVVAFIWNLCVSSNLLFFLPHCLFENG